MPTCIQSLVYTCKLTHKHLYKVHCTVYIHTCTLHTPHEYTCIPALVSFRDEEAKMELEGGDEFIEVKVTSPHKVGVGQWSRESRL